MRRLSSTRVVVPTEPKYKPISFKTKNEICWSSERLSKTPDYLSTRQTKELKDVRFYSSITVPKSRTEKSKYGLDDDEDCHEIVYNVGDFVYCTQAEGTDNYYVATIRGLYERPNEKGKEKYKCHLQWFYRTFDTKLDKTPAQFSKEKEVLVGNWIDENLVVLLRGHVKIVFHHRRGIKEFEEDDVPHSFFVRYKYTEIIGLKPSITLISTTFAEGEVMNEKKIPMGQVAEIFEVKEIKEKRKNARTREVEYLVLWKGHTDYQWTPSYTIPPLIIDAFEKKRKDGLSDAKLKGTQLTNKRGRKELSTIEQSPSVGRKRKGSAIASPKTKAPKIFKASAARGRTLISKSRKQTAKLCSKRITRQSQTDSDTNQESDEEDEEDKAKEDEDDDDDEVKEKQTVVEPTREGRGIEADTHEGDTEEEDEETDEDEKQEEKEEKDKEVEEEETDEDEKQEENAPSNQKAPEPEDIDLSISLADYLAKALNDTGSTKSTEKKGSKKNTEEVEGCEIVSITSIAEEGAIDKADRGGTEGSESDDEDNHGDEDRDTQGSQNSCIIF